MLVRKATGGEWESTSPMTYTSEDELQALVEETFEAILHTQSDAPAVIVREVAMPDHGRIDVLAVDADGRISICECKLASNPASRREVVGQVLEYAGWLDTLSFRQFRARVEARLGGDLVEAMAERAPDDWDRETWLDEVTDALARGDFRIILAVDELTSTLKQSVLYLNRKSDLPLLAVELERSRHGDLELLHPNVFAGEEARRRAYSPSSAASVEGADTVIVAARRAFDEYQRTGSYICQPLRSFREDTAYLGFYARRRIEPVFPAVKAFLQNLRWASEAASELRATGKPLDAAAADVIERDLADPESRRERGGRYQLVLLDPDAGFELPAAIRHESGSAWTRGQRYTSSDALKTKPATTDDLRAAGG